jgi:YD repeat-containing protein
VPDELEATVVLPRIRAEQRFVLHVDQNALDIDQEATFVYYDSSAGCGLEACDSHVVMPVVPNEGGGSGGAPGVPQNVRVTDLPVDGPTPDYPAEPRSPRLRVAWDPVEGASYRVYRSTSPSFVPASNNRVYAGPGEACPQGESPNTPTDDSPPGEERAGICFTDSKVSLLQTYYYRVVAVVGTATGGASGLAYGTPTRYDRQVRLKVDRLYGPQYWEQALVSSSPTPLETTNSGTQWRFAWDTLELLAGEHDLFARSFTQGIGSAKVGRTLSNDGDPNPDPDCGRGDDGDGDCEDDNDEEEDDDD